jgi:uncharacterized protein YlxP (DUF503 family)
MVNIKVIAQRFEIIKEKVNELIIFQMIERDVFKFKRSLQNFSRDDPYQMASYGINYLTAEHQWNKDELLSCIDGKFKKRFN